MIVRNLIKFPFLLIIAILCGCEDMDGLITSAGTYKVNARVNGIPLDECSFISSADRIYPYLEESVSNDPDVTALMVFLRNSNGEIIGKKVLYSLDEDAEKDELLISVKSLDDDLPFLPVQAALPVGRYTIVSQVMSGKDVLQRTEKIFYFLGNTVFSYEGINVHLPGITDNPQIILKDTVVMLEAQMDFDSRLDPYIIWYNGRRKISEGKFSEGAGFLLWKAPEQSGFYSIRAEVYPIDNYIGLTGYQKETSILVSSKMTDMHLISENIPQLVHWYILDGSLNDSKLITSAERSLKPAGKNRWISRNGTYGLAAGSENIYTLPVTPLSGEAAENWQILFRFMPLNEGQIFFIQFDSDLFLYFSKTGQNLVLTLASSAGSVSHSVSVPEQDSFITAGVNFSFFPDLLSARINVLRESVEQGELAAEPVSIEAAFNGNFVISLGARKDENAESAPVVTAIWDEFALYNTVSMEIIASEIKMESVYESSETEVIPSS